jgi:hypothetical protein
MTLGVGGIFWFISHTMSCQPKGLGLHIYSWLRQRSICQDASLICCPSNHHAKDHKDQHYTTMQRTTKTNSTRLIPSVEIGADENRGGVGEDARSGVPAMPPISGALGMWSPAGTPWTTVEYSISTVNVSSVCWFMSSLDTLVPLLLFGKHNISSHVYLLHQRIVDTVSL